MISETTDNDNIQNLFDKFLHISGEDSWTGWPLRKSWQRRGAQVSTLFGQIWLSFEEYWILQDFQIDLTNADLIGWQRRGAQVSCTH